MGIILPVEIQETIKERIHSKGLVLYLFNPKTQQTFPADTLDYNDPYAMFPPSDYYVGQIAISEKICYPEMVLEREGSKFAWRKRFVSNGYVQKGFGDYVKLPKGYKTIVLYFVPKKSNVEIHTPGTIIKTEDGVLDIDGFMLPYAEFVESLSTIHLI